MARAILSIPSKNDLALLVEYIGKDNPAAALGVLDAIDERLGLIAENPMIGSPRDYLAPGLRVFPVSSYMIYYRLVEEDVEIVRILHGARDAGSIFD